MDEQAEVTTEDDKGPLHVSFKEPYVRPDQVKKREGRIVNKTVKGGCINEVRKMKLIGIELLREKVNAYVDMITGSIYDPTTGRCWSSDVLYIAPTKRKNK
jgi:hypothetical protein